MMPENLVICTQCGAKNRIPSEKSEVPAKCGRCRAPLPVSTVDHTNITLRCSQCHTKNRVPLAKIAVGAKCGRCGARIEHQSLFSGHPLVVSDATFERTVLQSPLPVLLYAWAPWCSVCSGTRPIVDQLAMESKGRIRVGMVNIDASPMLAAKFDILSVPSFFIFDAGRLKQQMPGALPLHELKQNLAPYVYNHSS